MADFTIKRGDLEPAIKYQLQDDDGNPIDITGFQKVRFLMRETGKTSTVIDADTNGAVTVTDASKGIVQYDWQSGDTDATGKFEAEWEVTYSGGDKETFPNTRMLDIHVPVDIA